MAVEGEPGLPPKARRWAAFAIALAVAMSVLDGVMLNVALPSIARSFRADPAAAIWIVNAYQLAAALVLVPLGKMADTIGHSRIYLACMAVFTIASVGCALSQDLVTLSIWRFAQGCGGAGVVGVTNAMLRFTYPTKMLAQGIAINSLVVAMSLASGPTIASLIVELASWQWLFIVNVPIGVLLLIIGARFLPHTHGSHQRFDWKSALLSMATFCTIILAIDAKAHAEGIWLPLALGMSGIALGIVLIRRQLDQPMPLFPVDLLRQRMFGLSVGTMFGAAMAQIMAYVSLPFLFQHDLGRTQIETGLLFLPWPIALAVIAPIAGRLGGRYAPGVLCSIGLLVFALGLLSLATLVQGASNWDVAWRMALCGIGYGLFQPPSSRAMISSVPKERSGSASVMGASGRVLGQAIGAALVASMFRLFPETGTTVSLLVAAVIALAAMIASVSRGVRA
jgi:DHA2 family multidrug resistance protein-like MFS transporter